MTQSETTLLELAERVEALASPDRAMDAEIFKAIGAPVPFQFANKLIALEFNDVEQAYFARVSDDMRVRYSPPSYTASIDAALTLVPKGLVYNLGNDTAFCWAHVWDDTPDYDGEPYEGHASTLPRAIVAACLRALAIRNAKDNASYTGECICPKCGIRHGGTVSEGKF